MLVSISTTHRPATDLGFLLHKNPANVRSVEFPFGAAHVFYPEASDERCTASVLVEVDPVRLVRGRKGPPGDGFALRQYVNDRPYAASSFTSVALAKLFGTALSGRSAERPELAATALSLEAHLPALPCRGGEPLLRRLFEPLGYAVDARPLPLDDTVPAWGDSRYLDATLRVEARVADLLAHLYVLLPVLDDDKHYWVGDDEVDKLLAKGGAWLAGHPERELITRRYLRHQRSLASEAESRLLADEGSECCAEGDIQASPPAQHSLADRRIAAVVGELAASGAARVLDLGCGEGRLLRALLGQPQVTEAVGVDVSPRALAVAARRLDLDRLPEAQRRRVRLVQSSLTYRDRRLRGFDAAALVEVVEHVDPGRLPALERAVFGDAAPATVVVTTPNAEYNARYEGLGAGEHRHHDHRFEWGRVAFERWAAEVAARYGYAVRLEPVGDADAEVGPPTQMAVFAR